MKSEPDEQIIALIERCEAEIRATLTPKICYAELPVRIDGNVVDFSHTSVASTDLSKNLCGCSRAIVFAATVGLGIDRLLLKYTKISPATAFCIQAIGAERIEALCDTFNDQFRLTARVKPRFSPGYGDLPLSFQKEIFKILDCPRRIGLTLCESGMMTPTKSVSAIIGLENNTQETL
jgi:hypothetical protein